MKNPARAEGALANRTLDYQTMQQAVTEHLRSAIFSGELAPGARIQQDDLSRQLGVSRMPVREALRILASEGLVELRPHRGAVVVSLRPVDIAEVFEIRAMLEARAAQLAAPHLDDATIEQLRAILDELARIGPLAEDRWLQLNRAFHTAIYPASGWPRLCALIEAQRNVVEPYLRLALTYLGRDTSAHQEHLLILRAAEARDGELLARYTVEHLRSTARGLIGYLNVQRPDDDGAIDARRTAMRLYQDALDILGGAPKSGVADPATPSG